MAAINQAESVVESKASVLRGYIEVLRRDGLFQSVRERVSPEVRGMLDNPPPPSAWVLGVRVEEIGAAVVDIVGLPGWQRISREAVMEGLVPVLRSIAEAMLRLFGGTPATLFNRINQMSASTAHGTTYAYAATGPTSGVMTVTFEGRRPIPMQTFVGVAGGLEVVFDLCGVQGRASEPDLIPDGTGRAARYVLSWKPRGAK